MPRSGRDYQTIGEVVTSLRERFPDLTVSKVRFLEDEGLIAPGRTPGGYRKFNESDVARIELILRMQRDHFLPLAVIGERLEDLDKGRTPEELRGGPPRIEAAELPIEDPGTVVVGQASSELGMPVEFVRELARYGLIDPVGTGDEAELSRLDIEIAHAAWALRPHGVEPRHLKMFDQFAEREASLLHQVLMPAARLRTPEARQRVLRQLEELTQSLDDLKRSVLKRALTETFEDVT
jgi:DNA-binding transcriptional MerR regulator